MSTRFLAAGFRRVARNHGHSRWWAGKTASGSYQAVDLSDTMVRDGPGLAATALHRLTNPVLGICEHYGLGAVAAEPPQVG